MRKIKDRQSKYTQNVLKGFNTNTNFHMPFNSVLSFAYATQNFKRRIKSLKCKILQPEAKRLIILAEN